MRKHGSVITYFFYNVTIGTMLTNIDEKIINKGRFGS